MAGSVCGRLRTSSWLLSAFTPRPARLNRIYPSRTHLRSQHDATESVFTPRIAQSSTWDFIIPKALRNRGERRPGAVQKEKSTNPATYFIWIYILIGSQAVRIVALQNEFNTYMRKAELKIAKLREVVDKLQRGEHVDVEKVLGTGDEVQEREWEDALKEIETEEQNWQRSRQRNRKEQDETEAKQEDASPVNDSAARHQNIIGQGNGLPVEQRPPSFH